MIDTTTDKKFEVMALTLVMQTLTYVRGGGAGARGGVDEAGDAGNAGGVGDARGLATYRIVMWLAHFIDVRSYIGSLRKAFKIHQ